MNSRFKKQKPSDIYAIFQQEQSDNFMCYDFRTSLGHSTNQLDKFKTEPYIIPPNMTDVFNDMSCVLNDYNGKPYLNAKNADDLVDKIKTQFMTKRLRETAINTQIKIYKNRNQNAQI